MDEPRDNQREGGIVMAGPDTFGLPPRRTPGSILRRQVTVLSETACANDALQNVSYGC